MSARVYSVPGQPEGRSKAFTEWTSTELRVGVILTIIKVLIDLFLLVRIGNILAIFKINQ